MESLTVLAVVALGLTGQTEPKATIEIRAVPLKRAVTEIGKAYGVSLAAEGAFAELPLLVKFNDVPLSIAMSKIAAATSAEWADREGKRVLVRTSVKQEELARRERENFTQILEKNMQKLAESAKELKDFDDDAADAFAKNEAALQQRMRNNENYNHDEYMRQEHSSVAHRTLHRVLAVLPPSLLAEVQPGEPIVFALQPHRSQRALPATVLPIVQTGMQEQARQSKALRAQLGAGNLYSIRDKTFEDGLGRFLIRVSRTNQMGPRYRVDLLASNAKGEIVWEGMKSFAFEEVQINEDMLFSGVVEADDFELELSEASKLLGATLRSYTASQSGTPNFPPAAVVSLRKPLEVDPLSTTTSEIILSIANKRQSNVAALLPDSLFIPSLFVSAMPKPSAKAFEQLSETSIGFELKQENGWIISHSRFPLAEVAAFAPRSILAAIVNDMDSLGSVSLDTLCNVATSVSMGEDMNLAMIYFFLLSGDTVASMVMSNLDAFRIWANLTVPERTALMGDGKVLLRSSMPGTRSAVWRYLNAGMSRHTFTPTAPRAGEPVNHYGLIRYREITEMLPNGLHADTYLEGPIPTTEGVQLVFSPGSEVVYDGRMPMSAESYAQFIFHRERPDIFGEHYRNVEGPSGFIVGSLLNGMIKIHVSQEGYYNAQLMHFSRPKDAKPVPYSALPAAFREQVESALERQRKAWQQYRRDGDGD